MSSVDNPETFSFLSAFEEGELCRVVSVYFLENKNFRAGRGRVLRVYLCVDV